MRQAHDSHFEPWTWWWTWTADLNQETTNLRQRCNQMESWSQVYFLTPDRCSSESSSHEMSAQSSPQSAGEMNTGNGNEQVKKGPSRIFWIFREYFIRSIRMSKEQNFVTAENVCNFGDFWWLLSDFWTLLQEFWPWFGQKVWSGNNCRSFDRTCTLFHCRSQFFNCRSMTGNSRSRKTYVQE